MATVRTVLCAVCGKAFVGLIVPRHRCGKADSVIDPSDPSFKMIVEAEELRFKAQVSLALALLLNPDPPADIAKQRQTLAAEFEKSAREIIPILNLTQKLAVAFVDNNASEIDRLLAELEKARAT